MLLEKPFPAYDGDGPYVFVCYAHADRKAVYAELRWLHEQGINIWYDEGISAGAEFPESLGRAILDARMLLYYVSPNSARSRHCRDEVYFALDHDIPVLPAHLSPAELPPGLVLSLGTTQGLIRYDMPLEDYRRKLLAALASLSLARSETPALAAKPTLVERLKRRALPISAVAAAAVAFASVFAVRHHLDRQADFRWAKDVALPQIRNLIDNEWRDYTEAYALAAKVEEVVPEDEELRAIFGKISLDIDIDSEPPGADVFVKEYARPEAEWTRLGRTPIEKVRVPVGIFRWKFEKGGYEPVLATASSWDISLSNADLLLPNHLSRTLDASGEIPPGMVRVSGAETPHGTVPDFFIDRYEVTNAEFLKFVTAGGYKERKYWKHEFVHEGRVLDWDEAMGLFVDQTGRPGPAHWLAGTYPDGQGDYPVSVSWYEADAYAEFMGRSLPTGTHWGIARGEYSPLIRFPQLGGYAVFAPFSNLGTDGPVPVGSLPGITAFGAYDLAGNVREWCSNDAPQGKLVRGGAWSDNPYRFAALSQAPPMLRGAEYGFRTVLYPGGEEPQAAFAEVPITTPGNVYEYEVVSDEVFDIFRRQFDYDSVALDTRQVSPNREGETYTLERVSVATPYDEERMIINLFLPKNANPPYQSVIYFPGSASLFQTSSENLDEYHEFPIFLSFLVRNGRAVIYPVYQGTFERQGDEYALRHADFGSHAHSRYLVELVKDFRRTIDYLETRDDIDTERLAYYGMSWGAMLGVIIPAVERRLATVIMLAGGLVDAGLPEANPLNYAPRMTLPTLMLVGRYDSILGFEPSAKPLFDLIGTPEEHKLMKIYETDHIPPKKEYIAEILAWLDEYLGPVS